MPRGCRERCGYRRRHGNGGSHSAGTGHGSPGSATPAGPRHGSPGSATPAGTGHGSPGSATPAGTGVRPGGSGGEAAAGSPGSADAVKPMDEEEEKAASEEKDHISEDERNGTEERLPEEDNEKEKETKHVIANIPWTSAKSFTMEKGWQQIAELISTWDIHESWLHHIEFVEEEELKDSKRYHYRACWGLPTRRKPIPRATASVYFVIVISKYKPDTAPVEVFYRLESSRLIRRPEQCQFREKWLQDIVENKIACIERLASR